MAVWPTGKGSLTADQINQIETIIQGLVSKYPPEILNDGRQLIDLGFEPLEGLGLNRMPNDVFCGLHFGGIGYANSRTGFTWMAPKADWPEWARSEWQER